MHPMMTRSRWREFFMCLSAKMKRNQRIAELEPDTSEHDYSIEPPALHPDFRARKKRKFDDTDNTMDWQRNPDVMLEQGR